MGSLYQRDVPIAVGGLAGSGLALSVICASLDASSPKGRANGGSRLAAAAAGLSPHQSAAQTASPQGEANCGSRLAGAKSRRCVGSPFGGNGDDRRLRRKQGGAVGAAASKTRVPPKARSGCWVPQPGAGERSETERARLTASASIHPRCINSPVMHKN